MTSPDTLTPSRSASKRTGLLKTALTGGSIALTIVGAGLIAREASGQTQTGAGSTVLDTASTLPAIPTVMPVPNQRHGRNSRSRGAATQLQTPGQSGQFLQMPGLTQSRSSR